MGASGASDGSSNLSRATMVLVCGGVGAPLSFGGGLVGCVLGCFGCLGCFSGLFFVVFGAVWVLFSRCSA